VADIVWRGGLDKESRGRAGLRDKLDEHMTQLSEIYNQRILELSANIPQAERLADADATAIAHSKLCGSTVTVDLKLAGGRVTAYGQTVKACLLGQAAASVMGHNIVGSSAGELREVGAAMRKMLKAGGPPPGGRWADLAVLEPVKDYKARHASTLLVFDAVESALSAAEAKQAAQEGSAARGLACAAAPGSA
jgi:NifU-like protein involved in Fe-S cluster formation